MSAPRYARPPWPRTAAQSFVRPLWEWSGRCRRVRPCWADTAQGGEEVADGGLQQPPPRQPAGPGGEEDQDGGVDRLVDDGGPVDGVPGRRLQGDQQAGQPEQRGEQRRGGG